MVLQFVYLMPNAPVARFDSDPVVVMRNQASMLILVGQSRMASSYIAWKNNDRIQMAT
jgi:hypothetical protein